MTYGIGLVEMTRHVTAELFAQLRGYRFSKLWVELEAVPDCRNLPALQFVVGWGQRHTARRGEASRVAGACRVWGRSVSGQTL